MMAYPTGTITFLLTDVEGSTVLWEQYPEAMRAAMARHDALIEQAVANNGGMLVRPRGEGDSRFAVFETAAGAVRAAADIQRALASKLAEFPFAVRVRSGLHTGTADWRDGDYYGSAVNRCARIRGLAHGGQTLLSQATAELTRDALPPAFRLVELGTHRLKGLNRPESLFQLWLPDSLNEFPPLASAESAPNNLPVPPTAIIGRRREVADITALVADESVRLVTLTGPGGTGKTRLSLELGHALLEQFPDGVFFVDLAPITDPALVPTTVAHTLGLREGGGRPPFDSLKEYLATRQLLLILDNLEQVIAAAPFVGNLMAVAPTLKVLATSRIPLNLRGEREYPLSTLPVPPTGVDRTPSQLLEYESVRLFTQQAQSARPAFELTPDNAPAVVGICRRLDGLPLALEIAAARIRIFPPAALLTRLDQSMKLLVGGAADLPERHQTVRAAIDWSYNLLTPEEKRVFSRLSIFVGGFTFETAEAVANWDSSLDILSGIEMLVRNSLVRQVDWPDDEPRFDMLLTIRDYAQEKLAESGELPAAGFAHASYFSTFAEQAMQHIMSREAMRWLARTEADHDNYRAAMAWSLEVPGAAGLAARVASFLSWFWFRHSHFHEGREWTERIVRATKGEESEAAAMAHAAAAVMANWNGDLSVALDYISFATRLADAIGDEMNQAPCHFFYGVILLNQGKHQPAYRYLSSAAELFNQLQWRWLQTTSLVHQSNAALGLGQPEQALRMLDAAYPAIRQMGDQYQISWCLQNYGEIARAKGEYARARAYYQEAETWAREAEAPAEDARFNHNFGYLALHEDHLDVAESLFRRSLDMFRVMVMKRGICECLAGLAAVAASRGGSDWATPLLAAAETQLNSYGASWWAADQVEVERTRGRLRAALGDGEFDRLWRQGQDMSLEEALTYVSPSPGETAMRE